MSSISLKSVARPSRGSRSPEKPGPQRARFIEAPAGAPEPGAARSLTNSVRRETRGRWWQRAGPPGTLVNRGKLDQCGLGERSTQDLDGQRQTIRVQADRNDDGRQSRDSADWVVANPLIRAANRRPSERF